MEAIKELPEHLKSEIRLLLEGKGGGALAQTVGIQALDLGYISSDHLKAIADSARDLFICPARMDNMPLALIESIASSTPMVSFRVGGVSELVRTGITDYLAEPENIEDFRDGTIKLLWLSLCVITWVRDIVRLRYTNSHWNYRLGATLGYVKNCCNAQFNNKKPSCRFRHYRHLFLNQLVEFLHNV